MTILGYDIDGQPLRAGDRVVFAEVEDARLINLIGKCATIQGDYDPEPGYVHFVEESLLPICALPRMLRKLPPKQADNETTTWRSIEQLTGWAPEGVKA